MSNTTNTVRLHRVLRAPAERLYRAFLDPDAMVKWLPPHGFTGRVHEMDARVGGGYRMSFTNFSTGRSHSFGGRYVELTPHERIRYTDRFDDPNLPGEMQVAIALRKADCGTELEIVQEGLPSDTGRELLPGVAAVAGPARRSRRSGGSGVAMPHPRIVTVKEWEAALERIRAKEKELTRAHDALAAERRRLPWVPIEKDYVFQGPRREGAPRRPLRRAPPAPALPLHVRTQPDGRLRRLLDVRRSGGASRPPARARHLVRARVARADRGARGLPQADGLEHPMVLVPRNVVQPRLRPRSGDAAAGPAPGRRDVRLERVQPRRRRGLPHLLYAISIVVLCDDQAELDRYWNALLESGNSGSSRWSNVQAIWCGSGRTARADAFSARWRSVESTLAGVKASS